MTPQDVQAARYTALGIDAQKHNTLFTLLQLHHTFNATATLWSVPRSAHRTACIMRGIGGMRCSSRAGVNKQSSAASSSCR